MKDLKTLLGNYDGLENDLKFTSISDEIWRLGSLEEIKNEVSHEAFTFHIAVNMIGNWKCDGWAYIFAEGHSLLPYISGTLKELGLIELKNQFDDTVFWLKEYFANAGVEFLNFEKELDEKDHYDVINFLSNPRFKVEDEKLNYISMDDRKIVSKKYKAEIGKLEDISEKLWGYGTEEDGWKNVLDYIGKVFGTKAKK
ncbi:hypothetical protein P375_11840 [Gallibacterium genomosp. 2]|uniref:DUF4375 domain-containing protein n=1 Tax=Gallibacterium genomosp. 2 TaxID=155517 RepID=A0A0A2XXA8_9PAST|nr:hypothetical protein [Gallibacterium genomosp. 2]KGQ29764.1 hypothetical protein P375_11840 [Gallibacterium genomosp. 2]